MHKRRRIGPLLVREARQRARYEDAHAFIGGTGAVGGGALLQVLSMYEEMFSIEPPLQEQVPILLATGRGEDDIHAFTRRLFRVLESRHGPNARPQRIRSGYLTQSGVFVAFERFHVALLEEIEIALTAPPEARRNAVLASIESIRQTAGLSALQPAEALSELLQSARPFSRFLQDYAGRFLPNRNTPFRSVVIGIPIPSLIAYHHAALDLLAEHVPGFCSDDAQRLRDVFMKSLIDDLANVQHALAEIVIVAHTTGVGGMYDESHSGDALEKAVRLGFAHAAQDRALIEKHRLAEELANLYTHRDIKTLVTAAAIGIDEVRVKERVPLHFQLAQRLFDAPTELFPGSKATQPPESKASKKANRPVPARHYLQVFRPITVPLTHPPKRACYFEKVADIRPLYAIRSGENGFFSVANADALYRTMRVASTGELGHVLASVQLFGDDPAAPWFPQNLCYYTETDNSRQVFDFLYQPAVMQAQLSGLEPMALQDLGSSKHQGELHALALLLLLHRVRTLDIDALDPYVDPLHFDAARFFVERSRPLTFEDIETWDARALAQDMATLASADTVEDLAALRTPTRLGLFPNRDDAWRKILSTVLYAVWTVPSMGTPLIFKIGHQSYMRAAYFIGPLDVLFSDTAVVDAWFHDSHKQAAGTCSLEEYRDFHICDRGFVDLRPHAIVSLARTAHEDLSGKIFRAQTEDELRVILSRIPPYSYFSSCGLLAMIFRLRGLYRTLREGMIELGTHHEFCWQMPRDGNGHILVVPGAVEAFRMISEGLEKATGTERIDGLWGYERRPPPDRRGQIPGV
jgi:hypothetical protein